MQNIFSRSPWERPAVISLRPRLGQYSWNSAGTTSPSSMYSWNGYGMSPEQRLLQNAQESMNAPAPETPQQRLLKQSAASIAADCYTCANGDDIRSGVDAATATSLRGQGFRCRKDECAQHGGAYNPTAFNPSNYSSLLNSQPAAAPVSSFNSGGYGGGYGSATMMAQAAPVAAIPPAPAQPLVAPFPVVPVALGILGLAVVGKLIFG